MGRHRTGPYRPAGQHCPTTTAQRREEYQNPGHLRHAPCATAPPSRLRAVASVQSCARINLSMVPSPGAKKSALCCVLHSVHCTALHCTRDTLISVPAVVPQRASAGRDRAFARPFARSLARSGLIRGSVNAHAHKSYRAPL